MNPFSSVLVAAVLPKTQSDYIKSEKESNHRLYTKNKLGKTAVIFLA